MSIDRSQAPPFLLPDQIDLNPPACRLLPGGMRLYYNPSPTIAAVKLEVIFPVHFRTNKTYNPLVSFFTLHMLPEGTQTLPSEELDDFFDFHGSEVEILSGFERHGLGLVTTKKHLKDVLPVFRSLFTDALFPEKHFLKRKSQKKLSLSIQQEQTAARANQLIRAGLFGKDHPFGQYPSEADVDAVSREELIAYYRNEFLTVPQLFVTGDLSEAELLLLEEQFANLPCLNGTILGPPAFESDSGNRQREEKPKAVQSSIRMGKWMIPMAHPDYQALSFFNTVLGGYFGSRLIRNIREEKGYTYGINSFLGNVNGDGYWMVSADVKGGYGDEVIREVYKEIQRLISEPIPPEELEIVKNYLAGSLLSSFSNPFDLMSHFQRVHFEGLDFSIFTEQLAFIKDFDGARLQEIGATYFSPEAMQEVIVGQL
ncbi:Predicted Zn-dependent peptidase [Cyclobacterium xiamenense]|uniref:Predicted Zn-dependent peptidase n=1 Tax=Cyclobacterium xiamenense TaxID=1297121 RepID=A0A1H7A118_9BACT|nr:pitrilysin family protein [Cyclobacterium xiamenense]SEJ58596.1 Predicted Zn-dependent peptidase [Cyclobacterium xiamenense]